MKGDIAGDRRFPRSDRHPAEGEHLLKSDSPGLRKHDEPVGHNDPVLANKRHDVRHRADRRDVEQPFELPFGSGKKCLVYRLHHLEGRPGATKFLERIRLITELGIDDRERGGKDFRDMMVIDDDDVDSPDVRLRDLRMIHHSAVDREDEPGSFGGKKIDRLHRKSVSLGMLIRDIDRHRDSDALEPFTEQYGRCDPVRVEITEYSDTVSLVLRHLDTFHHPPHRGKQERIMEIAIIVRLEEPLPILFRDDATKRKKPVDDRLR